MSELLARAKREGTPLLDGNRATFVWEGETAPFLHMEQDLWAATTLQEASPGIWTHSVELPADAYVEYNYATIAQDPETIVPDPFNQRTFDTGIGHFNHFFSMPQRVHTPLIERQAGVVQGVVTEYIIGGKPFAGAFGRDEGQRPIWVYDPPVDEAVPLLVVYDGKDYQERGKIVEIVDNLIARGAMRPVAMLLIENAGNERVMEYHHGEALLRTLADGLLAPPNGTVNVLDNLNLLDIEEHPCAYGVLGASMGGLMALYTGLRMPHIFGHVVSQAGAFFKSSPHLKTLITQLVEVLPLAPLTIWQDCGTFDFLLEENREMHTLLQKRGYDVAYREHSDGHNYTAWRDQLPDALTTIFKP